MSASAPPRVATPLRMVPWLVAVAFFMESLDTTILNTAVPTLAAALGVAPLAVKSVLSSYTLSLAVFIPISGWVADRFGTRRVFASAIGIFTLGSVLCGISTDIRALVLFRVFQGIGGAMMVPVGRLTIVRTFPKSELVRAMVFVAVPALVGPMLGPLAGGLIVHYLHWRVIFFVNLSIALETFTDDPDERLAQAASTLQAKLQDMGFNQSMELFLGGGVDTSVARCELMLTPIFRGKDAAVTAAKGLGRPHWLVVSWRTDQSGGATVVANSD